MIVIWPDSNLEIESSGLFLFAICPNGIGLMQSTSWVVISLNFRCLVRKTKSYKYIQKGDFKYAPDTAMSVTCITHTVVAYGRKLLADFHCLPTDLDSNLIYHLAQGQNITALKMQQTRSSLKCVHAAWGNGLTWRVVWCHGESCGFWSIQKVSETWASCTEECHGLP